MQRPAEPRRPTIDRSRPPTGDGGPAGDMARYTVQIGDSLWTIAQRQLGAGHKWRLIARANNLPDNATLQPGQELVIPRPEPERGPVSERSRTDPLGLGLDEDMRTVTVRAGDSLWTIARREYRDGTQWRMIYTANRSRMDSPNDLHPGDELVVPPLPDNAGD
jgi:nucleoid-associated protein YgaU